MNEPQGEETIFAEALRLPADERAAYLARSTDGNAELRQRVEALLGSYQVGDFLEQSAATQLHLTRHITIPLTEKPGDTIGRYRLLQQIGEGGCGVVYMAEQAEPVRRRVALKIIKLGMDTKSVIARFEAERQAVAMMDHPNIAKVFDAGATETGRPYFVMELVRGMKITDYCDEAKLSTRARLDLFIQVCQAIQHAHQKGIIHRDIKPSNILVTVNDGAAVPKVIDFGIAKATNGQQLTDRTAFTAFEQFIGTPAYMSPEQAVLTSLDIDTRSDIYALGVLLYELLTGKTPFDAKELLEIGLDEMRRTIREQEPPRPSTRLITLPGQELSTTAQRRGLEAPKLVSALRGDLDWIVMKALEKDRARRYATANSLASDIERHLNNEPVLARPPSTVYRFQKLLRRNRVMFTAAGAAAAALLIGAAVSIWMFFQEKSALRRAVAAEQEQTDLRQQAETARLNEVRLRREAEATGSNEVRLRLEAEAARTNEAKLRRQAEVAERTAQAEASQLGDVLMRLGSMEQAEKFIRYSLAMQRKLESNDSPEVAASLNNLANVILQQGTNFAAAELAAREALALRRKLLGDDHPDTADSLDRLGYALYRQGKYSEGQAANYESLGIRRKVFGDENLAVANSLLNLGSVFQAEGKINEAERSFREALATGRKLLGDENNYVTSVLNILGQMLFDNGQAAEAEPLIRECLAFREKKRPDDWPTFATQSLLGAILLNQQSYADAERLLLSSCESMEQHQDKVLSQMKQTLDRLIQLYESTERADVAAEWRRKLSKFENAEATKAAGQEPK